MQAWRKILPLAVAMSERQCRSRKAWQGKVAKLSENETTRADSNRLKVYFEQAVLAESLHPEKF